MIGVSKDSAISMTAHWVASTASIHNLIIYLHIEPHRWQTCSIWLSICTLNRIDGKHTQSDHQFARHAYKGLIGLTVGLIYICMYPIYQVCLRVWQKDTPKGYYFDNRWYTSVASATTGLDSTRPSTPTGVVHWARSIASMHNLIIYLCQRRQSTQKTINTQNHKARGLRHPPQSSSHIL